MADDLPIAPNGEVKAYDRLGNKVTVPKDKVGELYAMGGRVARRAEVDEAQLQTDYEKKSTVAKVAGALAPALPLPAQMAVRAAGAALPPELEAYRSGAAQTMTGGLETLGTQKAVELMHGKDAARAFGQSQLKLREAHEGMYTGGEVAGAIASVVAGSAGGAAGLGRGAAAIPGAAVNMAGGLAERGAARVLGGLATKGALGRAVATGGELAARGAAEGAILGASQSVTEDILGDRDIAADKLFATMGTGAVWGGVGGFALGAAGSLLKSGATAAVSSARTGLARAVAKTEAVAGEAASRTTLQTSARGVADDLAFDALGATKGQATKALQHVDGGSRAVGNYVNRRILKTAETGFFDTVKQGRADELLPLIQADKAAIGAQIGDVVQAHPVRVDAGELFGRATKIGDAMLKDPTRIQGAEAFTKNVDLRFQALTNAGHIKDGTIGLSDMYKARADMERVAYEMSGGGKKTAAELGFREWLREVDGVLVDKLDEAAKAAGSGAKEQILSLKREYQLAATAEKLASKGAERVTLNNTFGIREAIAGGVGLATGHPLMGVATAMGGKALRERGSAAGAHLMSKMADMEGLATLLRKMDDQLGRSAKGLLGKPAQKPMADVFTAENPRVRAERGLKRLTEAQADPEAFVNRAVRQTEGISSSAPELAGAITKRTVDALAFLASKAPASAHHDPLNPREAPQMTDQEAYRFARYDYYTEKPQRFFAEVERGKLTFEGAEVAQALMPGAFAELQMRTAEGLAELLSRGVRPPFQQRQNLGTLLDFAATPAQRVEHMAMLQMNVSVVDSEPQGPAKAPRRPSSPIKPEQSTLDRLQAQGPGRR